MKSRGGHVARHPSADGPSLRDLIAVAHHDMGASPSVRGWLFIEGGRAARPRGVVVPSLICPVAARCRRSARAVSISSARCSADSSRVVIAVCQVARCCR